MDTLDRLAAVEDLRRVMAGYVQHADYHRWQDLAELFVEDGSFTPLKVDGSELVRMQGRKQIAALLAANTGPRDVLLHHLFSDLIDVRTDTTAHGVWAMEDWFTRAEPEDGEDAPEIPEELAFKTMRGYGHYHADFVKTDAGWRIRKLVQTRLRLDFT
jgi:hypothetical protein